MAKPKKYEFKCLAIWYVRAFHVLLDHYVKMEATNAMLEQFLEPLLHQKDVSLHTAIGSSADLQDFINRKITKTQLLEYLNQRGALPFTFDGDTVASWDKDEAENDLRVAKAAVAAYKAVTDPHYVVFKK